MGKYKFYCWNKDSLGYTAIVTGDEYEIEKKDYREVAYSLHIKKNNGFLNNFSDHIATIFCDHFEIKEWVDGEAWSKLVESV